ncbi:hypothetical protein C0966_13475 [Bacillus methanolicus]|uniref:hypothetical protein n=1 Tax=Bacillus methanolicus TaxID=1471 RepID=UPI002380709F|nr:hypothetical protein [Bacillus methanolicus]MDE3840346.1 hypothetical protein [Bacillus methanolicus]
MKSFFFIISIIGALGALYYLYQRQLGAISFFILSIFFFSLAFNQLSKRPDETETDRSLTNNDFINEKSVRNRR